MRIKFALFTASGGTLRAIALRPPVIYGEGDVHHIPKVLRVTKYCLGYLPNYGSKDTKYQKVKRICSHTTTQRVKKLSATFLQIYVGNIAWAHIQALRALQNKPEIGSRFFYITDDSPLDHMIQFVQPFTRARGYRQMPVVCPFLIVFFVAYILELIAHLLAPLFKFDFGVSISGLKYSEGQYYVNSRAATKMWGYQPLFTHEQAMQRSLNYYKNFKVRLFN